MVTFNFSNVSGDTFGSRFVTTGSFITATLTPGGSTTTTLTSFTSTLTAGNNPIQFTSGLTGASLPGDTIVFTVSTSSPTYFMRFNDSSDQLDLRTSGGALSSRAIYTMTFDAGNGLTRLSNVQINGGGGVGVTSTLSFLTTGGSTPGLNGTGTFAGEITGIRFTVFNAIQINSITGTPTCFARGTRIAVPGGEASVEDLAVGDTVLTHEGATREVLFVGRQSFDVAAGMPDHLRSVRIAAGALGNGLPKRDLVVTADHALLVDGMLVNAGALVDGDAITFDTVDRIGKRMTVYHVETEDHALILAEGCPAETFIDAKARARFDNYDAYLDLYGVDRAIPAAPYTRISSARMLPETARPKATA